MKPLANHPAAFSPATKLNEQFSPTSAIESDWKEARSQLKAYLLALHLTDSEQQERIIAAVIQQAAIKFAQNPAANPTVLAMNEFHAISEQWFGKILASDGRDAALGLLSCFALDTTRKWPALFLADEIPAHFQHAVLACEVRSAPALKVSSMVPLPFDNTLQDAMSLPTALGELTKNLSPSLAAKAAAFVLSAFTLLTGKLR